jgi:hypothetical protein
MHIINVGIATDIAVSIAVFNGATNQTNKNISPININGNSMTIMAVLMLLERM